MLCPTFGAQFKDISTSFTCTRFLSNRLPYAMHKGGMQSEMSPYKKALRKLILNMPYSIPHTVTSRITSMIQQTNKMESAAKVSVVIAVFDLWCKIINLFG